MKLSENPHVSFLSSPWMSSSIETRRKRRRRVLAKLSRVELATLPMAFAYSREAFFLRDCYEGYFEMIMNLLDDEKTRRVTITGSPGIGKSVFYLYFVPMYRKERSKEIVVTASFTDTRNLTLCRVYYPDNTANVFVEYQHVPNIPNALYIYDGTPDMKPPDNQRMICFTSPHRGWSKYIRKDDFHTKLHMPVWTESELYEANDVLELGISYTEIRRRLAVFGGIARACLGTNTAVVQSMETALFNRVAALDPAEVEGFIRRNSDDYNECHRIFLYHPLDADKSRYAISVCSSASEEKILETIKSKEKHYGYRWIRILSGINISAGFRGNLFEMRSRILLNEGGRFNLTRLGHKIADLSKSQWPPCSVLIEANKVCATRVGFPAVDAYYVTHDGNLFLFQQSISDSHSLNIKGIRSIVQEVQPNIFSNLETSAKEAVQKFIKYKKQLNVSSVAVPENIAVVFVVPKDSQLKTRQSFVCCKKNLNSPVTDFAHLDSRDKRKLAESEIFCARDLLRAKLAKNDAEKFAAVVKTIREMIIESSVNEALEQIPQYLLVTEDYMKSTTDVSQTPPTPPN